MIYIWYTYMTTTDFITICCTTDLSCHVAINLSSEDLSERSFLGDQLGVGLGCPADVDVDGWWDDNIDSSDVW